MLLRFSTRLSFEFFNPYSFVEYRMKKAQLEKAKATQSGDLYSDFFKMPVS